MLVMVCFFSNNVNMYACSRYGMVQIELLECPSPVCALAACCMLGGMVVMSHAGDKYSGISCLDGPTQKVPRIVIY